MQLVAEAQGLVPRITAAEVQAMNPGDVLIVDVREDREVASSGMAAGAIHASRGTIEFKADLSLPNHDSAFAKDKTIVLYCASGGRAALAGKALLGLGYEDVRNLGGLNDWIEAGGAVEKV
jgi:rhodanese-related sulfurtransferase